MDTILTNLLHISTSLTDAFIFNTLDHKMMLRVRVERIRELTTNILDYLDYTESESSESST